IRLAPSRTPPTAIRFTRFGPALKEAASRIIFFFQGAFAEVTRSVIGGPGSASPEKLDLLASYPSPFAVANRFLGMQIWKRTYVNRVIFVRGAVFHFA